MATQMVPVRLNSTDTLIGYMEMSLVPNNWGEVVIIEGEKYSFVRREWNSQNKLTVIVEKRR
jgi:hypothetical protein